MEHPVAPEQRLNSLMYQCCVCVWVGGGGGGAGEKVGLSCLNDRTHRTAENP